MVALLAVQMEINGRTKLSLKIHSSDINLWKEDKVEITKGDQPSPVIVEQRFIHVTQIYELVDNTTI